MHIFTLGTLCKTKVHYLDMVNFLLIRKFLIIIIHAVSLFKNSFEYLQKEQ